MYAKNLQEILAVLSAASDVSRRSHEELTVRFRSLREYGRLPRGRERREEKLSTNHVAEAVFGLVPVHPAWAGHAAILLADLRPVGGTSAAFSSSETLSRAVASLLLERTAREEFIRLTLTLAETGVNSNGGAELFYERLGEKRCSYYVPSGAVSLLNPGREVGFDPDRHRLNAPAMRQMSFNRSFFEHLAREWELAERFPAPLEGIGDEYSAEEAEAERYRKLGVRPNSRFLNVGVDNQITWPKEEKLIKFDRFNLVLMPKTKENVQSVHIDLTANRLSDQEAMTVINRFLSVMAWCDDNFAVVQWGWSGNPVPVAVSKRDLAFTTSSHYPFSRKIPDTEEGRRALALFREARNAEQNSFISYAVLNYYKIIEIRHAERNAVRKWFQDHFDELSKEPRYREYVDRFLLLCGDQPAGKYIHNSCRIAVAHAGKHSKSDPDEEAELERLHTAARVMHILARRFIEREFGISDVMYSGN